MSFVKGPLKFIRNYLGTKQQKDGFHIMDNLKTCEKIPDPPLYSKK